MGIYQPGQEKLEGNNRARILTLLHHVQEDAAIEDPGSFPVCMSAGLQQPPALAPGGGVIAGREIALS